MDNVINLHEKSNAKKILFDRELILKTLYEHLCE